MPSPLAQLKAEVCEANLALARLGLAPLTWGNVSGILRDPGLVAIKPSGVPYDRLRPADLVIVGLDGRQRGGKLKPSTDLPTHLALYRAWPGIGGIAHAHSPAATIFAQAGRPVPCLGTTHADCFAGDIPVARELSADEIAADYETATGTALVELFRGRDPLTVPGALIAHHGPFAWGPSAGKAVENCLALELIARMALGTRFLNPAAAMPPELFEKHFARKHGPNAYYGQVKNRGKKKK